MPRYGVDVERQTSEVVTFWVDAETIQEAETKALEKAEDHPWSFPDVWFEIMSRDDGANGEESKDEDEEA